MFWCILIAEFRSIQSIQFSALAPKLRGRQGGIKMKFRGKIAISIVLLAILTSASPGFAAPVDEVKALLDKGNAAGAYALGKNHPEELGNPQFDFYFGVAAIDSGHAGEGVLALERYTVNFPDNVNARLELARGYFVLGDDLRAREEFDAVLNAKPPAAVVANIERFLDALRSRESTYRTTAGVFMEAGFGYDSNVNGGVGSSNISLPVFGRVVVAQTGVKTDSNFSWLAIGGQISHPVSPGLAVFAGGQLDGKFNSLSEAQQFDQGNIVFNGGISYFKDRNFYRLTASHAEVSVDYNRFRNVDSLSGEWLHQLDELQTISPFVQTARFAYTGNNQVRDADFLAAGIGYRKAFIDSWQPLMTLSINTGKEHNTEGRPDLGREIYGARAALAITPIPKWAVSIGGTYQKSRYDGPDPLLGTTRNDNYYAADAVASYAYTRDLSLRTELLLSKNSSNLELYTYRRDMLTFKIRYDFR